MPRLAMGLRRARSVFLSGTLLGASLACGAPSESPAPLLLAAARRFPSPLTEAPPLLRARSALRVTLPASADLPLRLQAASGVSVAIRWLGAPASAPVEIDGLAVFAEREDQGLIARISREGVEDFVRLPARPPEGDRLRYELTLEAGARGLRQLGNVLEILDQRGVPRIRMEAPYILDASGQRLDAEVTVRGCEVDRSPAAPWRRPVVSPGAERCELELAWPEVSYPVLVDPAWKTTSGMLFPRQKLSATVLESGDVLVVGGNPTKTTELYKAPAPGDPQDLGAFAASGELPWDGVELAAMGALPGNRAVLHGGVDAGGFQLSDCWLYEGATGTWKAGPIFNEELSEHELVTLPDGRLLFAGGEGFFGTSGVTAIFDPTVGKDGAWIERSPLLQHRRQHGVAATKDGYVVVAGGRGGGGLLDSTEIYDVAQDLWTDGPALGTPRKQPAATALPDGRVVVSGGAITDNISLKGVVAISPASKQLEKLADMQTYRGGHRSVVLADGRILLAAGSGFVEWLPSAELYDPLAPGSPPGATEEFLLQPRRDHALVWLGGMRALVLGGDSNFSPTNSAELFQLLDQGSTCTEDEECLSRHCTDGVCCQESCSGECEACSKEVRGTEEPDGVCAARGPGSNPRKIQSPICLDDSAVNPCGTNGRCNGKARTGAEACQIQVAGVRCGEQTCGAPAFAFNVCDGKGACVFAQCSPYARCDSPDACATSCLLDSDCVASHSCSAAGACEPRLENGASCAKGVSCQSGFCVDGVCCESACDGLCRACSSASKGGGADGLCEPVIAGKISSSDCEQETSETCGFTGACDGKGSCALYGADTACGPGTLCGEQADGVAALFSFRCSGGACIPQLQSTCGLFACAGEANCATSCQSEEDCVDGAYCEGNTCTAKLPDGQVCQGNAQCASEICADGVCCNTACDGQCETCNQPGVQGTCVAVVGSPPAGRPACAPAEASNPCSAARCDGVERKSCAGFVGGEQSCAPAVCKENAPVLLLPAACAGNGLCRAPVEQSCSPYACTDGACKDRCSLDADCAAGARCEGERCVMSSGCEDATTLRQADGSRVSCAPFRCDAGARSCFLRCFSSADCSAGNVCSSDGRCEPPRAVEDPERGGCTGCATPSPPARGAGWLALMGLAALALRRGKGRVGAGLLGLLALVVVLPACSAPPDPPPEEPAVFARMAALSASTPGWPLMSSSERASWVKLPEMANAPVELHAPAASMSLAVHLEGAAAVLGSDGRGLRVFEGALGDGTTVLHRPSRQGVEDFVLLERGDSLRELRYRVDLGQGVAGLRFVSGSLEFLDADGTPRLRMATPYALLPGVGRRPISVAIEGCAYDADPRAPWGRAVTRPGATSCVVRLSWAFGGGPLLIDPAWQSTGIMTDTRALHTATKLPGGLVLVAGGGINFNSGQRSSSELYDPSTGTWAKAVDMSVARASHGAWLLEDGRVLVASGATPDNDDSRISELYDPKTGLWSLTGMIPTPRYSQTNGVLPDGRPFVCGGYSPNPDVFYDDGYAYNVTTEKWSKLPGKMLYRRRYAYAFPILGGRILVASGKINTTGSNEVVTDTTEIYDPVQGQWSPGPTMLKGRQFPSAALTPEGVIFSSGISSGFPPVVSTVEMFRFSDETFVSLTSTAKPHVFGTAIWLPQEERALITGGADAVGTQKSSELIALSAVPALGAGDMSEERGAHTATLLDNGVVLIAGGGKAALGQLGFPTNTAELFSTLQVGQPCLSPGQCPQMDPLDPSSRYCVDGVCCDAPCQGVCMACSSSKKGEGSDGACASILAGSDPDSECPQEQPTSCGRTGSCSGQGACALYPEGTSCAHSCASGLSTEGVCSQGSCVLSSTGCGLFTCDNAVGECRSSCAADVHCAADAYCQLETAQCAPKQVVGASCTSATACQSGFCVDGVCCESACDGACMACAQALQEPSDQVQDGQCLPAKKGAVDPRGLCENLPCDEHDTCDGLGQCLLYTEGETCSTPKCLGDGSIGFRVALFTCQKEQCALQGTPQDCGAFACQQGACLSTCEGPQDCSSKAFCRADKLCTPLLPLGASCANDGECSGAHCVDGVCCNDACAGPCGSCNTTAQPGRCVPVKGDPPPGRPLCPTSPGDPCQERLCDGLNIQSCEGFVGSSQVCETGACTGGRESSVARCDGKGSCGETVERDCFPFVCGDGACKTSCAIDADCAEGNRCAGAACVAVLICEADRGLLRDSTGAIVKECGLYRCSSADGACLAACDSTADCVGGAICSSQRACEVPPRIAVVEEDCSCKTAGAPGPARPSSSALPLLFLALLLRRSRSSSSPP